MYFSVYSTDIDALPGTYTIDIKFKTQDHAHRGANIPESTFGAGDGFVHKETTSFDIVIIGPKCIPNLIVASDIDGSSHTYYVGKIPLELDFSQASNGDC